MELNLVKLDQTEFSTISKLFIEGKFMGFVLEDGEHINKIFGSTRIDPGRYEMIKDESTRFTYQFGYCWHLLNTPRHTEIKIHKGNRIQHTDGCLLPNKEIGFNGTNYYGINSKAAYDPIMRMLKNQSIHFIDIIR